LPSRYLPEKRLNFIVGNFGSGKTEVAVNLALGLAQAGRTVSIADLDIVNPYFRCREAKLIMEKHRVRVVVPPGAQIQADLPIIMPELAGMFRSKVDGLSLIDVGGDDAGSRVLSAFAPLISGRPYELWQVINSRRPFTRTVEGCLDMQRAIEASSRLSITGLVVNSHLMDETTPEVVLEGWRLATAVAATTGQKVRCVCALGKLADAPELAEIDVPLLRLQRYLAPSWLDEENVDEVDTESRNKRVERPRPIGMPPRTQHVTGKEAGN